MEIAAIVSAERTELLADSVAISVCFVADRDGGEGPDERCLALL